MSLLLLMANLLTGAPLMVQGAEGRPRIFLDCSACDIAYVQEEIGFVSYVRDREAADIHVIVTGERTASGGQTFTLAFIGQGTRAGHDQTLAVTTRPDDSEEEIRASLVQTLRLGLLRYVAGTELGGRLVVSVREGAALPAATAVDRWNHWIFALRGEASLERDETSGELDLEASVAADRITSNWKLTTGAELAYSGEQFEIYLDDLSRNRLVSSFELALRIRRGLALSVQVEGSRIRDQLSLPARGASPEEILLRQRQIASGYEVELALGITYRFGSMFSSIVNPRFGN